MIDINRIHPVVFGLQSEAVVFFVFVKGLDGRIVVDQGEDDLAVFGGARLFDQHLVAVQDSRINHALTLYRQKEEIPIPYEIDRKGNGIGDIFRRQDGDPGGDFAQNRYIGRLFLRHQKTVVLIDDFDGAIDRRSSADIVFQFQFFQTGVDGRGAFNIYAGTDLPDRRGVAVGVDKSLYIKQYFHLAFIEIFVHRYLSSLKADFSIAKTNIYFKHIF